MSQNIQWVPECHDDASCHENHDYLIYSSHHKHSRNLWKSHKTVFPELRRHTCCQFTFLCPSFYFNQLITHDFLNKAHGRETMIHEASHLELGSRMRNLVWINPFLVVICYSHSAHTRVYALHCYTAVYTLHVIICVIMCYMQICIC